jgi:hypothetical protein
MSNFSYSPFKLLTEEEVEYVLKVSENMNMRSKHFKLILSSLNKKLKKLEEEPLMNKSKAQLDLFDKDLKIHRLEWDFYKGQYSKFEKEYELFKSELHCLVQERSQKPSPFNL